MATTADIELIGDIKLQTPLTAERQAREFERRVLKNFSAGAAPLGRLTGKVSEFDKSLEAANARVIAFGASAGVIAGITTALQQMVSQAIKVEKTLLDINVLFGQSASGLAAFSDSLFEVAKNTGQSFFDVAEAAKEFSRQGLGVEETLARTSDAMILARLTGLEFTKSVEQLTASVNQFSKEGLTTADVINRLANVDAKFAVSAKDLSEGLSRAGSVAQDAGASFNELIALITAVQQRTARGGAVIGNALKTIFTRAQRSDTLDSLEQLGIGVRDLEGNTLPVINILSELSQKYDSLGSSQQAFVSELVGGGYQINIVKSLFDDLGRVVPEYAKALDTANKSTDEAYQRNELLNKSLASLANEAGQNLTKLAASVGKITLGPALENIFGLINSVGDSVDGKGIGEKIGTGILTGIGDFIGGPGLVYLLALAGKLFKKFGTFAKDSIGEVLSLGAPNARILDTQKGIVELLNSDIRAREIINSTVTSQVQKEQQLIALIKERVALDAKANSAQIGLSRNLVNQGVIYKPALGTFKTKAGGHIPMSVNSVPREAIMNEVIGAKKAGYSIQPSDVRVMKTQIDGKPTTVVYNNKEKVIHDYMGSGEPAIIPPTGRIQNYAGGGPKLTGTFGPMETDLLASKAFQASVQILSKELGIPMDKIASTAISQKNFKGAYGFYDPNKNAIKVSNPALQQKEEIYRSIVPAMAKMSVGESLGMTAGSIIAHEYFHNAFHMNKKGTLGFAKENDLFVPRDTRTALEYLEKVKRYSNPSKTYKNYAVEEALATQFGKVLGFPQYAAGRLPSKIYRGVNSKYGDKNRGAGSIGVTNKLVATLGKGNYSDNKAIGGLFGDKVISKSLSGIKDNEILNLSSYNDIVGLYKQYETQLPQGLAAKIKNSSGAEQLGYIQQAGASLTGVLKKQGVKLISAPFAGGDAGVIGSRGLAGRMYIPLAGGYMNAALGLPLQTYNREELLGAAKKLGIKLPTQIRNGSDNEIARFIGSSKQHQALVSRQRRSDTKAGIPFSGVGNSPLATTRGFIAQSRFFEPISNTPALDSLERKIQAENSYELNPGFQKEQQGRYRTISPAQEALGLAESNNPSAVRVRSSQEIEERNIRAKQLRDARQRGERTKLIRRAASRNFGFGIPLSQGQIAQQVAKYTAPKPGIQYSAPIGPQPYSQLDAQAEFRKQRGDALLRNVAAQRLIPKVDVQTQDPSGFNRRAFDDYSSYSGEVFKKPRSLTSRVGSFLSGANTKFENLTGFGGTEMQRQQSREKFSQRAFLGSFAAPLVGGFAQQAFGSEDTTDQRRTRAIGGIASSIGTGLATGATIGGPWGAAIGGVVALFGSMSSILDNLNPSLEDLTEKIKKDSEERDKGITALAAYSQLIQELEINQNLSNEQRSALEKRASQAASRLDPEEKALLANADDKTKLSQELLAKRQSAKDVSQAKLSIPALLKTMQEDNYKKAGGGSSSFLSDVLDTSSLDFRKIDQKDLDFALSDAKGLQKKFAEKDLKIGIKDVSSVTSAVGISPEAVEAISKESKEFQDDFVKSLLGGLKKEVQSRISVSTSSQAVSKINAQLKNIRRKIEESLIKDVSNQNFKQIKSSNFETLRTQAKASEFADRSSYLDFAAPQLSVGNLNSAKARLEIDKAAEEVKASQRQIDKESEQQRFASFAEIKGFAGSTKEGIPAQFAEEISTYLRDISLIDPSDKNSADDALRNLSGFINAIEQGGTGQSPETQNLLEKANQLYNQQLQKLSDIERISSEQKSALDQQLDLTRQNIERSAKAESVRAGYSQLMGNFSPSQIVRGQQSFSDIAVAAQSRVSRGLFDADKNRATNEQFALKYATGDKKFALEKSIRDRNVEFANTQALGIEQEFSSGGLLNSEYINSLQDEKLKKSLTGLRGQKQRELAGFYESSSANFIRGQYSAGASPFLEKLQGGSYSQSGRFVNQGVSSGIQAQLASGDFGGAIARLEKILPTLNKAGQAEASTVISSLKAGQIQLNATKTRSEKAAQEAAGGGAPIKMFLTGLSPEAVAALTGQDTKTPPVPPITNTVNVNVNGTASAKTGEEIGDNVNYKLTAMMEHLFKKDGFVIPPKATA